MKKMPLLGQGTWKTGEDPEAFDREVEALRTGLQEGIKLIDTAEMYGDAESVVGEAIKPFYRDDLYLVSKVYPHNSGEDKIEKALDRSLNKLGTDYLDLYLLHWRGGADLEQVVRSMEKLKSKGKIRRWGVSNFDVEDMIDLFNVKNGSECAVNQVLYHLASRGTEFALREWMREHDVHMMAYCPLAKDGRRTIDPKEEPELQAIAKKHGLSVEQLLLAFVLHQGITAIPKAATPEHAAENAKMKDFVLPEEDFNRMSRLYPAPTKREPLDIV